jgi:hypothetical protein
MLVLLGRQDNLASISERRLFKILELPKQLQVSILALLKLGRPCLASEVAAVTGKARAVESNYLNQLVVMKLVRKERRANCVHRGGPKVFFSVDLEALYW